MRYRPTILALILGLLLPAAALAQTGPCATGPMVLKILQPGAPLVVCFNPSPDHDAVNIDGQPKLTRYEFLIFADAVDTQNEAVAPLFTLPIGKPTPNAQGAIWVTIPLPAGIATNTRYQTVAKGFGTIPGTGTPALAQRSLPGDPFAVSSSSPIRAPGAPRVP